jgi:hypothetical protein
MEVWALFFNTVTAMIIPKGYIGAVILVEEIIIHQEFPTLKMWAVL